MEIRRIPVAEIKAADYNPRKNLQSKDREWQKLDRSIREFGFVEPLVWNQRTGNLVGGHQRLKVLIAQGVKEVEVSVVDLDLEREKALNVALNKVQGDWDSAKLEELLADLNGIGFDLTLTGFDMDEINEILKLDDELEDDFDEEKALEEIVEPVAKLGDIWALGEHRLICGDSTDWATFERLIGGKTAALAVTSPPYGVGKSYEKKGIEPWFETIRPVINNICKVAKVVCWQLGDLYSTGGQFIEPTHAYSIQMFMEQGFRPIWIRIWKKQGMNFGVGPYHLVSNKPVQQYEYIGAFEDERAEDAGEEPDFSESSFITAFAQKNYRFVKRLTQNERKKWGYAGIWEINTVKANKEHPAMFPVELPWRCIKMHSDPGDIILEPFSGSGTTLIAAHKAERKCYGVELDPKYVDVAVKRYEALTGDKARRL